MTIRQPQVFISYQRADEPFARQVREHLAAQGVQTWMDQYDIPVGAYWPDEIDSGLADTDIVVGILSPDAVESRNVKNEWDWAIQNEKRLLLLQVAPCLIPHRYISINYIDATGADPSSAFALLSRALGAEGAIALDDVSLATPDVSRPVPIRHAPRSPRPAARTAPFVAGREREQDILRSQIENLSAGRGSLVLIGGEAGIGKTTLTNWLAAESEARGAVVLAGGCYDLTTTPPYGPWGEVVRGWPQDRGLPPVPEALRGGEAMDRLQSQAALFELATDLLATAGSIRPIVLFLEDLHWADQPSIDLLRYVGRLVAGFRMLLVATYRSDEITRQHPLFALIPTLAREAGTVRISLQRLGPDAVRDLIASRYAITDDERERVAGYVQRVTEGNPFFASEVLRTLEEARAIEHDDAGWRLRNLDDVQVPELVRQVIEGRLARLGDVVYQTLQSAAVIGHEIPVDLWIAVSGEDEGVLSETLDRATDARIVEELPGGNSFRFTHALIRETLYAGLGLLRRRALHRRAGEVLIEAVRPDPDTIAHHFRQAGDDRAFDWLVRAGDRANQSYAWMIAAERYEQAAAVIADDRERARESGWLLINVASMLRYSDTPRAISYIEQAANIGASIGDAWLALSPLVDAGYYHVRLGNMREGVDRMQAVGREMESAARDGRLASCEPPNDLATDVRPAYDYMLRMATERPDQAVILDRSLAVIHLVNTGRIREAQALAEQLAAVWPSDVEETQQITFGGDWRSMFADLYFGLADIDRRMGRSQQSLQSAQIALSAYVLIPHYFVMAWCYTRMLQTLIAYQTEEIELRRATASNAVDAAFKALGAVQSDASPDLHRTSLWIVEGRWVDAYSILHARVFPDGGASHLAVTEDYPVSDLAAICVGQGRREEALDLIRSTLPDGSDTQPGNQPFESALNLHAVAASLALDIGDLTTARAWLAAHDRWLDWSGSVLGQVEGHLGWSRYHRQAGDLDAAEAHAHIAFDKASNPRQPLGLLASHRLLGELETERGNQDNARSHLSESLSLADACAAPFELALTLVSLAELDIAVDEVEQATEKLTQARSICERLEARPALERIAALERRLAG